MPEAETLIGEVEQPAIFDAEIFKISHVSSSGFDIKVRNSMRRRDSQSPFPLNEEEAITLRDRMKGGEIQFAQSQAQKLADSEGREVTSRDYVEKMIPKVGIRNITQENVDGVDTLFLDTRPISFPVYSDLIRRENQRPELSDFGEATGSASIIFTSDGQLILQYRGKGNRAYGNIPGASAAGLLDGKFDRSDPSNIGTLTDIDPTANLRKEITEELGIDAETLDMKVLAIAHDEIKPHHEVILNVTIPQSSEELAGNGLIPDDEEGHDFKERYFTIDGTPEAISKLLINVKCPLPSTHAAAFFIAGFQLVADKSGSEEAYRWAREISGKIKENYAEIDRIVQERYGDFPEQSGNKPVRSRVGYDPLYTPEEQGLPSLLDELKRTELISEEMFEKLKAKYDPPVESN